MHLHISTGIFSSLMVYSLEVYFHGLCQPQFRAHYAHCNLGEQGNGRDWVSAARGGMQKLGEAMNLRPAETFRGF